MKTQIEIIISILFVFFSFSLSAQRASKVKKYQEMFESCDEAYKQAHHDVEVDAIKLYELKSVSSHDKYFQEDPAIYYKRRAQFDSIMLNKYNVKVHRYKYWALSANRTDRTCDCYNSVVLAHLDSIHSGFFYIRVASQVAELNGEPPIIDSTWVYKKEVKGIKEE